MVRDLERRYKTIVLRDDDILGLLKCSGVVSGSGFAKYSYDIPENTTAITSHYDFARGGWLMVLHNPDWPIVPPGVRPEVIEPTREIIEVPIAECVVCEKHRGEQIPIHTQSWRDRSPLL